MKFMYVLPTREVHNRPFLHARWRTYVLVCAELRA